MDSNNQHLNITIEYPGTSACRIWYMTTAGDHGPDLRFYAMWSQICAAHVADPEVGSHPFSRVTGITTGDDGLKPYLSRSTSNLDAISAPDGLKPGSVLQEWAQFCEETIEGAAEQCECEEDNLTLSQVQAHMPQVWGADDEEAVESIRRRDRTEQLEEVVERLDSAAIGQVLVTAKTLLSVLGEQREHPDAGRQLRTWDAQVHPAPGRRGRRCS